LAGLRNCGAILSQAQNNSNPFLSASKKRLTIAGRFFAGVNDSNHDFGGCIIELAASKT
jgi:hypothetical protein